MSLWRNLLSHPGSLIVVAHIVSMVSEHEKGEREVAVFKRFLETSHLPIDPSSIQKCMPPHPDILCRHLTDGEVAFELVELCDPNLAKSIAKVSEDYLRTSDPSSKIISKKLRREYNSAAPVELLCYTAGRILTPDNVILPTIKPYLRSWQHVFRRAWLLGCKGVYVVWANDRD
ncbi:MAG: hypothetical protein U1D41_01160 [Nitrosomonas sp.]|jgi:hypothetical protein|uniref:hypothetical protein n=1 Tax=Nitrosomonas sp. TaxID=42353 RepID=UPI0027231E72|nr:hypothetical protein [Nitrosomonas sp.]MDO8893400.1 hypothetical protein [Nitrosomonas sp.]MDP3280729.1 hypothetical protein [Nitrosomonas sp.]MDP3663492.1 hypothetical protein [Nitrosomonas sp.]MDZ4104773.1 hypothetical protein [Nitrosomonas sp.]